MTQMIAITKKIPEIASNIRKLHSNTGNKVTRRIMTRGFEIRTFCLFFRFIKYLKDDGRILLLNKDAIIQLVYIDTSKLNNAMIFIKL